MSKNKRVPAKWIVLILSILLTIGAIPSSGFAAEVSQEDNTGADTIFSNTEVDSFEEASPDSFRQTENGLTEEVSAELPLEDEMDHLDEASGELPLEDEMDNPDEKPGELSLEDEADHPDEISEDMPTADEPEVPESDFSVEESQISSTSGKRTRI